MGRDENGSTVLVFGGRASRFAQPRRREPRVRDGGRTARRRSPRRFRRPVPGRYPNDRRIGSTQSTARHLRRKRVHRGRRLDDLRSELPASLFPGRDLCRQDFQGCKARRPAHRAADQVRADHQSQSRQSDQPRGAADATRPRGRGDRVKRRQFITLLGGAAAVWPLAARAQQSAMPVIGFLNGGSPDPNRVAAFRRGLSQTGYVEGHNVAVEYHWAEGQYDRLPALARELVRRQVSVIAATSTPAAMTAKAATTTIPIVFTTSSDPVQLGLAASLSRPGGNLTGATQLNIEVTPKRLEILHELLPTANLFALLVNPTNPYAEILSRNVRAAASALGLQLHILQASTEHDFAAVFATVVKLRAGGLVIGGGEVFLDNRDEQLAVLALRHRVPTIYRVATSRWPAAL